MRNQTRMLLVIALGIAFATGQSLASPEVREQQPEANLMTVLVARKDVPSLVFLTKPMEYFQEKGITYEAVPRGACHSFDDIKDQMLLRRIAKGEAITQDHFRKPAKDTFPIEVPSGQIPFTIRVPPDFLGGNPRPLARVNVVLVFRDDDRKAKSIVERAMILAWDTDNAADEKGGSDNLIVVAVHPLEAEKLKNAMAKGTFIVRRPKIDDDLRNSKPITIKDLLEREGK